MSNFFTHILSHNNYTILATLNISCYYRIVFVGLALEPTKVKSPKSGSEHIKNTFSTKVFLIFHYTLKIMLTFIANFPGDDSHAYAIFADMRFKGVISHADFLAIYRFPAYADFNFFRTVAYNGYNKRD